MARRMGVSVQALQRMEKGDSAVSLGIYVTSAFCLNRLGEMKDLFSTANDAYGVELENRRRMLHRRTEKKDADIFEQPGF